MEQVVLLVRHEPGRRVILSAAGDVIGHTCWRRAGWLRWVLEVHEEEQSPLLCTIARRWPWSARREVRDAEGDLVGMLAGAWVLNRWERVALRLLDGRFVSDQGETLANWFGGRLELLDGVRHDPFAKMLIVAAILAH